MSKRRGHPSIAAHSRAGRGGGAKAHAFYGNQYTKVRHGGGHKAQKAMRAGHAGPFGSKVSRREFRGLLAAFGA